MSLTAYETIYNHKYYKAKWRFEARANEYYKKDHDELRTLNLMRSRE